MNTEAPVTPGPRRLHCAEVWGGTSDTTADVESAAVLASISSASADGGKGGDIYYLSVCGQDMLTRAVVADVVGHGAVVSDTSGVLYDALVRHMNSHEGADVFRDLNVDAAALGLTAMTTAAMVAVYTGDNQLCFAYAGHHPALLRRRGAPAWTSVDPPAGAATSDNLPLAVLPDAQYDQHATEIASGDRIVLYTDGVIEAASPDGDLFGVDRLVGVLDRIEASAPLSVIPTRVLEAVREHAGSTLDHDDVTLLALEAR